jgi:adenylate cyclase
MSSQYQSKYMNIIIKKKLLIKHSQYICIFLISLLLVTVAENKGVTDPVEYTYLDLWHAVSDNSGTKHSPQHVVLVEIDDESLDAYSDEPLVFWTPQIAKASEVLREVGVKVTGLDFLFSISPEQWLRKHQSNLSEEAATYDVPIRREIATGKLVLVASTTTSVEGTNDFLLPTVEHLLAIPDFDMARHIGLADLISDKDGVIRKFIMTPSLKLSEKAKAGSTPKLSFAALLALRAANADIDSPDWLLAHQKLVSNAVPHRINYAGPPGTIDRISIKTLLEPDALNNPDIQALKDKVVIIGANYHGMNDTHGTPYSSGFFGAQGNYMTGPEVQANIVETLLVGNERQEATGLMVAFYQSVFLMIALYLFRRLKPGYGFIVFLGAIAAVSFISYQAFANGFIVKAAGLQFGLMSLYLGTLIIKYYIERNENAYITNMFGRYVSRSVVDSLIATGEVPSLGGVSQEVSVLFSDIRNFTSISERLNAEEVVEMLNTYFESTCDIVLSEGGTIDKFIGDAIMVQFGAPLYYEDHADRALRTALKMQEYALEFNQWFKGRFPREGIPEFAIGIGVHSGEAVIGNIGSSIRMEYTAIGDTVNTASRIEGQTKELGCPILASKDTLQSCLSVVTTGVTRSVSVKGKEKPVELFEVLSIEPSLKKATPV